MAWWNLYENLKFIDCDSRVCDTIKLGNLAEIQLYACVGVELKWACLQGMLPHADEGEVASPLYWAAGHNQLEIVRFFVESGHDIEEGSTYTSAANVYRSPPLFAAAGEGNLEVVRYLVEQGADKNVKCFGDSSFSTAAYRGHLEVVRYLVEQGVDNTTDDVAFELAIAEGHVDVLEYLLDVRRMEVDGLDYQGWTALHHAASEGQLEVAQLLFRYGATLDIRTNDGDTPTDLAIRYGHHDVADAIRAEEIRRRDHGFKRDRSTIAGTEEHEAAKRPRAEREAAEAAAAAAEAAAAADESDDDDHDDDDEDE
jgi:hypothetical protein